MEKLDIGRRSFLKLVGTAGLVMATEDLFAATKFLRPVSVDDPLSFYPERDWEKVYRDMYKPDDTFVWLCAPNDTHNCYLRAYVKNGIVTRNLPTYGYGKATDLIGNRASQRWDPRACQRGITTHRRVYDDRKPKGAMIRRGFLEWVEAGFPREENGLPSEKYLKRGKEPFIKLTWDEAFEIVAKAMTNIAQTYSGESGAELLRRQGFDEEMIDAMEGSGVRTMKFRGGMALLGITRIFGVLRVANMMALLDSYVRGVGPDKAKGGRALDSYTWHTDLAPGTPMTTGYQTADYDFINYEHAKLIVLWGSNQVTTKMPAVHWFTEARMKGAKVIDISIDYHATSNKADDVIIIRPGTDGALALGCCHIILKEGLYDSEHVKAVTDFPHLVRTDTWKKLQASDIIPDYKPAELTNGIKVVSDSAKFPEAKGPAAFQDKFFVEESLRNQWGDYVMWDKKAGKPWVVSYDYSGAKFKELGIEPALEGEFKVTLTDGKEIKVIPVFQLIKEYLEEFTPENTASLCHTTVEAVKELAYQIAANRGKAIIATGAGNNHWFNTHLCNRHIHLLSILTDNYGHIGGCSIGNWVGNYRIGQFSGQPQFNAEDPFNIELDPARPAKVKSYMKGQSLHYINYGDRPLKVNGHVVTDPGHMPTPTKVYWQVNSNSSLGNAKWHFDLVNNTMKRWELVIYNEWHWTGSCEYSDVVFGVDSWLELKYPDMTASCSNPFYYLFPPTPLKRVYDTRGDVETYKGVADALTKVTGDRRFGDYWHFVDPKDPLKVKVYLQRILNATNGARGFKVEDILEKAKQGTPVIAHYRTYPRVSGWTQAEEGKPYPTRSGRQEYYIDQPKFIEFGENLPVYREPIDSTHYEPNVIVGKSRALALMRPPEAFGLQRDGDSLRHPELRQVRNVVRTVRELIKTEHPLRKEAYRFCFNTPKYRHSAHTTAIDTDTISVYFGPFGDIYRHDKRQPWVNEGYVDINPLDAKELGIEDGDYIWIDADPIDRPYRGWKPGTEEYKFSRLMCRARYYNGIQRGTIRMYFSAYTATLGSVEGHERRPDGLARNPRTNYQAQFRYGSHQSGTRAWLGPTLQTDTLTHKQKWTQVIIHGFETEVHCTNGAPKESYVKVSKAEQGGLDGGLWRPASLGLRPLSANESVKRYLNGGYITL